MGVKEVSLGCKCLMFCYNIVFWILGGVLIAAGLWAWSEKGVLQDLSVLSRFHSFDPVWALLAAGAVMFVLGFCGCVGALRENLCLLKTFTALVGLIYLLELAALVLVVFFQTFLLQWLETFFMNNIRAYRDDIDLQNLIDSLQTSSWCCGAKSPDDWDHNPYFSCNVTNASRERCGVPFSCCILDPAETVVNSQCGYDVRKQSKADWSQRINTKGCVDALKQWFPSNTLTVVLVFAGISMLQCLGIYFSRRLISDIYCVRGERRYRY